MSSAHPTDSLACSLLRVGGEVAKKRGDDGIDDSHIVEAQDLVQRGRLRNRIRDQTQYAHLLLETLASLKHRGATPARSKTINSALNVVVLTLLSPESEEKTFYEEFRVSVEQESDSQKIMKAAFTAFEPPVGSGASTAELSFPCSHRLSRHFRSIKC